MSNFIKGKLHCRKCRAEKQREFYAAHKETEKQRNKVYRESHRDVILEKHECECGGSYSRSRKSDHEKTKKHIEYMSFEIKPLPRKEYDLLIHRESTSTYMFLNAIELMKKEYTDIEDRYKVSKQLYKVPAKKVRYLDFDDQNMKEIILPCTTVYNLEKMKGSITPNMSNFEALKQLNLI